MAEPAVDLIRRAQAGDVPALSELLLGQQHYIYSIAMSVLHHPDDAADLTQEACIRLCRSIGLYNGESRFTTWLYRMVVNLCRDELRRRGRQVPTLTSDASDEAYDPLSDVADHGSWGNPARMLDDSELRDELRVAMARLEPHYRLALTLYYFDELKYSEIAEILELPLNTVKSHIRRGKEHLAQIMRASEAPAGHPAAGGSPAPRGEAQPPRGLQMALLRP